MKVIIEGLKKEQIEITNFNEFVFLATYNGEIVSCHIKGTNGFISMVGNIFQGIAYEQFRKLINIENYDDKLN